MFHDWRWWFTSDSGLKARVAIGVVIFAILAIVDLRRHGRSSRRWREYLFLLLAATLGVLYGTVNNLISSSISWEFFYYGKGLDGLLGPRVPPDPTRLGDQAMLMGMKAAGSAYLLVGVALLLANNPRRRRKQLPFGRLILPLFGVLAWSALFAVLLGWRGGTGMDPSRTTIDSA